MLLLIFEEKQFKKTNLFYFVLYSLNSRLKTGSFTVMGCFTQTKVVSLQSFCEFDRQLKSTEAGFSFQEMTISGLLAAIRQNKTICQVWLQVVTILMNVFKNKWVLAACGIADWIYLDSRQ